MKRLLVSTIIALVTLLIGITFVAILSAYYSKSLSRENNPIPVERQSSDERKTNSKIEMPIEESPEERAIHIAEEFVAQNGYTDLTADKSKITYETVEFSFNIDELLKFRANTLERKAYGILYEGTGTKMGKKGWTVVFRSKGIADDYYKYLSKETGRKITKENYPLGRAVTMDANLQNPLVEHKDFPLENVNKKLRKTLRE